MHYVLTISSVLFTSPGGRAPRGGQGAGAPARTPPCFRHTVRNGEESGRGGRTGITFDSDSLSLPI